MRRLLVMLVSGALAALVPAAPAAASFGFSGFDVNFEEQGGAPAVQAGSHPYAMTTTLSFNTEEKGGVAIVSGGGAKDVVVGQIPGFIGNQTAVPHCATVDFLNVSEGKLPACANSTAVGTGLVTVGESGEIPTFKVPVYNLEPPPGSAAKLGFWVQGVPVVIDIGLAPDPPYNLVATSSNISQVLEFFGLKLTLWGVPADPAHDGERGACYLHGGSCPSSAAEVAFLTMPRACAGPLATEYALDPWADPGNWVTGAAFTHDDGEPPFPTGMFGCSKLSFNPSISAQPTTEAASSPTGLDFSMNVDDEGLTQPAALAEADLAKAVVTLPEGMAANPSIAEGLGVCSEAQLAAETVTSAPGAGCPNASKIGSVEVDSLLIEESLQGSLFVAKPYENPFGSLLALYIVVKNPNLGIIVKQPAEVRRDPVTGQLTTVVEDVPQLPFSQFRLHFREGARSPLTSPPACGSYQVTALLYPSSGGPPVDSSSAFQISSGPDAGPCPPGGLLPFHPGLQAGTLNNAAGHYSPFDVRIFRSDSEQEITHFSIKLPPGVSGKLAGIPFCPEAAIAAAKAREGKSHGGAEELESPSCPAASYVGRTLVGAGVGPALTYAPGKVYLAGPYHGAPLSIVAITAAKVGPFDLGTVVVREALRINPETAEVFVDATGSDPIPHIIDGLPVRLRDIRVYVDRPEFVLNPTNCEPTSTASTVLGSGLDFGSEADDDPITVSTRFQAADCASLGFGPRLSLALNGGTKRSQVPKLKAVLRARPGDANIGRAVVVLPPSVFLEQSHIRTICTRVQFAEGAVPGSGCPAASVYGHAKAITPLLDEPLEGPVFLRANGGERDLPDLVAALHSGKIDVNLVGYIDAVPIKGTDLSRIRNTFAAVPDAPVTSFTLQMDGGKKGLLVNSTDICRGTHRAKATFTGQNGRRHTFTPELKARGCAKRKRRG